MVSQIEPKLVGGIRVTWGIAKNILLRYPRWPPQQLSWISSIASITGALLQVSLCHGLLTMVRSSSVHLSVTFHIFDISIRIVSMMAATAAILKVFSCYLLPNSRSDRAETWWKASGQLWKAMIILRIMSSRFMNVVDIECPWPTSQHS